MNIKEIAYELYKIDWEQDHAISGSRKLSAYREYCDIEVESLKEYHSRTYLSFEDYLEDHSYSGELYVCFNEFLEAEYLDVSYMQYLLQDAPHLMELYEKDIELERE